MTVDDAPADPATLTTVAPKWEPGDTIPPGRRTLRVIGVVDVDETPVLVIEDTRHVQFGERHLADRALLRRAEDAAFLAEWPENARQRRR